ncbi:hypothetical protein A2Y85_03845 [candidate division WOR-3 bacterium RBG_13_43_14]|uniref:DUF6036 domain-containing protein n=1 Tax=candidate division WOR-3 bacterium RBG_13_43_14 TaxID=1802590 RepID=A0A1F4U243_UNCW3|nr:MAG: hypothetical protein A2Y85_03845 [candidate division WOR-3 bacterium RBG_13_43_14]
MDIENLLRSFNDHKVKFVIIGAAAFPIYGYARTTLDIDIFIKPTRINAQNCLEALSKCGYDISDLTIEQLLSKKTLFRQYYLEIDIHPYVKGITFETIWKHRARKKLGKVLTNFASLDDLIKMKKAAGRFKDRQDLKVLLRLREKIC